jgi:hypothetical protein
MANSILNSSLFRKLEASEDFFTVEDLLKEIHKNIVGDRELIQSLLSKAISDSSNLEEQIKTFNNITTLPNVLLFGEIPNKYLDNLNDNIGKSIDLLNSVQKLQGNYIASTRKVKEKEESTNIEQLIKGMSEDAE